MHVVIRDQSHNRSCHLHGFGRVVIGLVESDAHKHRVVLPNQVDDQVGAFGSICHRLHVHLQKVGFEGFDTGFVCVHVILIQRDVIDGGNCNSFFNSLVFIANLLSLPSRKVCDPLRPFMVSDAGDLSKKLNLFIFVDPGHHKCQDCVRIWNQLPVGFQCLLRLDLSHFIVLAFEEQLELVMSGNVSMQSEENMVAVLVLWG